MTDSSGSAAPSIPASPATASAPAAEQSDLDRYLPAVVLLFVGSGCAALIYEIVWFQLLQFVIGSSAVSLGVLLGTFMGGMCIGSLAFPRMVSAKRHPLFVYALLEAGIGVIGLAVLFGLPHLDAIYSAHSSPGVAGILWRAVIAGACLLPPTFLMGATLPAVARWVESTPKGVSWLGFFYGGNIAGAVCGCLLAGFYLLRVFDMAMATYVAATINGLVAAIALMLASVTRNKSVELPATGGATDTAPRAWGVYAAIGVSGLSALGAEVTWTRLLSLMIGGTVYTFSIILAVFLVGLGIGSSVGAILARGTQPRRALGICQLLLAVAISWTAYQLARSLPFWPISPSLSYDIWNQFQLDIVRCAWALFPPALLWGASFPLALAAVTAEGRDPGRVVGGIYAANTVGAIIGALLFSVVLIAMIGTRDAQRALILLAGLGALLALGPDLLRRRVSATETVRRSALGIGTLATVSLAVAAALGWLVWKVPSTSGELIAHGRYLPLYQGQSEIIYQGEGMNSSVAVSLRDGFARSFHVSGKVEASSIPQDMRLQRMLAHIPAVVHPQPKSVLIVGCGAGVTAGSFIVHPHVERIVICEIEPLIPRVVARYFDMENYGVVTNNKVEIVFDDARHFILTTKEKFDIITSDPIHPWVKGAAALYTREYFELCKQRLNPGGVITQWVPLYESNEAAVKSELATFFEVFPEGTVWSNDLRGAGYDVVLLGQEGPLKIDVDLLDARLSGPDNWFVARSLEDVGFESTYDLLATYAGRAADLKPWLANAEINRDRNLRLQYLAGMGSNYYREEAIYRDIVKYRRYPTELFQAKPDTAAEIILRMESPRPSKQATPVATPAAAAPSTPSESAPEAKSDS